MLSQLEGVDLEMYKEVVLPRVLEQVSIMLSLVLYLFSNSFKNFILHIQDFIPRALRQIST